MPLRHSTELLRFASVPFVATLAAIVVLRALASDAAPSATLMRRAFVVSPIAAIVLFQFVLPSYAVTVTKYVIDGPASIAERPALAYSAAEFRYAIAALLITVGLGGGAATLGAVIYAVALTRYASVWATIALEASLLAFIVFIAVRLTLLFPAIALDRAASPQASWKLARRNFWRLSAIWILTALPYFVPTIVLRIAASNFDGVVSEAVFSTIFSALIVTSWTTTLAWQASAYQYLSSQSDTARMSV